MREYDKQEVAFLQKQDTMVTYEGMPVLIKKSPTAKASGWLDEHERALIERQRAEQAKAPSEPKEPSVQEIRDSMGFPNRNLCTEELYTKFETIHAGGNEVGLWRYYKRFSERKPGKPCLIFFHGGGWLGGTPYTVENPCRLIAQLADAVVFNVDYSLAPEKKFPNGFQDCCAAVRHVWEHAEEYGVDRQKIAVGGDSAGGNLAAAVSLWDRDMGTHDIALQVLIYPCVTMLYTGNPGYRFDLGAFEICEEQRELIDSLICIARPQSEEDNRIEMEHVYLPNREAAYHPYVSPLLALSHRGLPKALCISAEFDGLRLQTEYYAGLLRKNGCEARAIRYNGVSHAFLDKLGFLPQTEDLCMEIAQELKQL